MPRDDFERVDSSDAAPGSPFDATLVHLARRCPAAFEPLYLRYRDRVLAYCYRRLGDRDEAEDAASAVFVAALRGLHGFRDSTSPSGSFREWLFSIAHNEIAMRWRQRSRHPQQPLDTAAETPDLARSPEEHAILADRQRRLAASLSGLPPRERDVMELRLADLQTDEIARVLGTSEQNVRTAQSRAVARLRLALQGTGVAGSGATDG
jgi:RNA polymerase sigma-70 factor (ECF subfamily)